MDSAQRMSCDYIKVLWYDPDCMAVRYNFVETEV